MAEALLEHRQLYLDIGIAIQDPTQLARLQSVCIEPPTRLVTSRLLRRFSIGAFSYLNGGEFNVVKLGRYCSIAQGAMFLPANHPMNWLSTHPFQYSALGFLPSSDKFEYHEKMKVYHGQLENPVELKDTIVGNDVWIGHGATILNGVKIGDGAVIATGAVVTRDVPAYSVVAGSPAKVIKKRFSDRVINRLELSKWWSFAPWSLRGIDFAKPERALDNLDELISTAAIEPYNIPLIQASDVKNIAAKLRAQPL